MEQALSGYYDVEEVKHNLKIQEMQKALEEKEGTIESYIHVINDLREEIRLLEMEKADYGKDALFQVWYNELESLIKDLKGQTYWLRSEENPECMDTIYADQFILGSCVAYTNVLVLLQKWRKDHGIIQE